MPTSVITVRVEDPASRDRQLEQATSLLREKAIDCGILVTRVDFTIQDRPQPRNPVRPDPRSRFTVKENLIKRKQEQRHEGPGKHPLLVWAGLHAGDIVSFQMLDNRDYVGTVESKTIDGLNIWIRNELNERKMFHFHDCRSVRLIG